MKYSRKDQAQTSIREVARFDYISTLEERLRSDVFCSSCWQDDCCNSVETSDGRKVTIDMNAYPPGGPHQTAMRRCVTCGRWAPPAMASKTCVDCDADGTQDEFVERMKQLHREFDEPELVEEIVGMYWRRPVTRLRASAPKPRRHPARKDESDGEIDRDVAEYLMGQPIEQSAVQCVEFPEHQTSGGSHWLSEALDMTESPKRIDTSHETRLAMRDHFDWIARDSKRRALGCRDVILPEDEDSLVWEIIEYRIEGKLKPTVGPNGKPKRYKRMKFPDKTSAEIAEVKEEVEKQAQFGASARNMNSIMASSSVAFEAG